MEKEIAVFGGGCFWCTEAIFKSLKGVKSVEPGYAGGQMANPTYEDVCTGTTGHAEVIKIEYDPKTTSFHDLLEVFFGTHDPTTLNRQGDDTGEQYRSVIFYTNTAQKDEAEKFIEQLETEGTFDSPIVTQAQPLDKFYEAEDYHKNYFENNSNKPYCQLIISPKIAKLRQKFASMLKS